MYKFLSAAGLLATFVLAGCATAPCGSSHNYYSANAGPALKAPAGMSWPKPDPAYAIPDEKPSTGKPTDLDASGACMVKPPKLVNAQSSGSSSSKPSTAKPGTVKPPSDSDSSPAPTAATSAPPAVASGGPIG